MCQCNPHARCHNDHQPCPQGWGNNEKPGGIDLSDAFDGAVEPDVSPPQCQPTTDGQDKATAIYHKYLADMEQLRESGQLPVRSHIIARYHTSRGRDTPSVPCDCDDCIMHLLEFVGSSHWCCCLVVCTWLFARSLMRTLARIFAPSSALQGILRFAWSNKIVCRAVCISRLCFRFRCALGTLSAELHALVIPQ